MNYIVEKLKSRVTPEFWNVLIESDAIIAGGAITSICTNSQINDLDIYFRSAKDFTRFLEGLFEIDFDITTDFSTLGASSLVRIHGITPKSLLMQQTINQQPQMLQAITYNFFPEVQDIFKAFDFTINMGAVEVKTENVVLHDMFLLHNAQRHLSFNQGTMYPIVSLLRVRKYEERGYKISKTQMLRIALTCLQLNLTSWEDVRNHCGGMYGLKLDEVFDESVPFSIDTAINQLASLKFELLPDYSEQALTFKTAADIYEAFKELIILPTPAGKVLIEPDRIFKNVSQDTESQWASIYQPSFKYPIGGIVNGGREGLFAYKGMDVVKGMYFNHSGKGWVLELVPVERAPSQDTIPLTKRIQQYDTDNKVVLKGDWQVTQAWPAAVFKSLFTGKINNKV